MAALSVLGFTVLHFYLNEYYAGLYEGGGDGRILLHGHIEQLEKGLWDDLIPSHSRPAPKQQSEPAYIIEGTQKGFVRRTGSWSWRFLEWGTPRPWVVPLIFIIIAVFLFIWNFENRPMPAGSTHEEAGPEDSSSTPPPATTSSRPD